MKLVKKGKTKDVYELPNGDYLLKFKDDATGTDGVFDPGANTVGLTIKGAGKAGLRITEYFFRKLRERAIPIHCIDIDIDNNSMTVEKADFFGEGVEVICRYRAVGSFIRRYGKYAVEGQPLDTFVEFTLKDDERNDPPITKDALVMLNIMTEDEYNQIKEMTKRIAGMVKEELELKGIELYDIKFEFGKVGEDGQIVLIDEISGGNMRTYKNGHRLEPLELSKLICDE